MVVDSASGELRTGERALVRLGVPAALLCVAALGWWWSVRMADHMRGEPMEMGGMTMSAESTMGFAAFLIAWLAMMAAMMMPAITPVVKLYARASGQHRVAPLPYFVAGYLSVWMLLGLPAYFAWRALEEPLAQEAHWAARLAGACFVGAGVWQLTRLKDVCLRHCRTPMSLFLRHGRGLARPSGAVRMGATHGLLCTGCCWAMFAVLVAVGTMHIGWMVILAALILVEKTHPRGPQVARLAGFAFLGLGAAVLVSPTTIALIT